ncbi:hypothetical protein R3P38DRAFT_1110270 [Favolaschia claudopus]|uniref:ATP synthase protein MI25 n=1 Tax=Favolaschia claudopus TaxID=2862362 RepID=A0AAW0B8G3_9AGAR
MQPGLSPLRSMYDDSFSQLPCSLLLGSLSLIPNDTLRYTAVGLAAGAGVSCAILLKRPSVQLRNLEVTVNETEDLIRTAKEFCSRDVLVLAEESVNLLQIKRSASIIQCRILDSNTLTWKKYRLLWGEVSETTKKVKKTRTTIQLIMETERQRQFTDDINATQIVLGHRNPMGSPCVLEHPSSSRELYSV